MTSVLALHPQLPTPPRMSSSSLSLQSVSGMELDLVSAFALRVGSMLTKTLTRQVEPDQCSSVAMVTRREIISCEVSSDRFCRMQEEIRRPW